MVAARSSCWATVPMSVMRPLPTVIVVSGMVTASPRTATVTGAARAP